MDPAVARTARLFTVCGAVQGVGFRPFVRRLAVAHRLAGWVRNDGGGVTILVRGQTSDLAQFRRALSADAPPAARIEWIREAEAASDGEAPATDDFRILPSRQDARPRLSIPPDLATCGDCRRELFDATDRRFRYPFLNCTQCGPRFSILRRAPYDRAHTSMAAFAMCPACQTEYDDPADRRNHAQPNACPVCGPRLWLADAAGRELCAGDDALRAAVSDLRAGRIVAVKGLGGFHLVCDARSDAAVGELRRRKQREAKPFAVLFPDLAAIRRCCEVEAGEAELLSTPAAPIVLLRRRPGAAISSLVAPDVAWVGAMLPYTPLHHLLSHDADCPLVATSGNLSDEPICIDNAEALQRLVGLADVFLLHDRPIVRAVDDSVARFAAGRPLLLRRSRGFAPLPVPLATAVGLATGAHLKNTVAVASGSDVFLSQHLGDLETHAARDGQAEAADALRVLVPGALEFVACDRHPDYASAHLAEALATAGGAKLVRVQHHHAHLVACASDNGIDPRAPVLAATWDGTGLGLDQIIWGGEFLRGNARDFQRVASLRSFRLPGGERAVLEPWRSALGLLHDWMGASAWDHPAAWILCPRRAERATIQTLLDRDLHCPRTSSLGRLFDAVAALLGCQVGEHLGYEGQAAVRLEARAWEALGHDAARLLEVEPLHWTWNQEAGACSVFDLGPALPALLEHGDSALLAARFHRTLVSVLVDTARRQQANRLLLTGGCFQNRLLLEGAVLALRRADIEPVWHRDLPPNDGSIALGQIVIASAFVRSG